jgi:thiamine pyrophosphokinase
VAPPDTAEDPLALIFAGGEPLAPTAADRLPARAATVVAADSGLHHARAIGRHVDVVVGDLDSADPAAVEAARVEGAEIVRHPTDKDATDLELAMDEACARGARKLVVVGGGGGRFDHLVANVLLLASPRFAAVTVEALVPGARFAVVHRYAVLHGAPGSLVSLLPVGGPATGVRTEGLRFPLRGEELLPGSTRGVSNVMLEPDATVSVERGAVLALQPDLEAS